MDIHFFDGWDGQWYSGMGVFGFVIAIILIGSFFSYLKERSRTDLIREAMRSGQPIDPALFEDLRDSSERGGLMVGGLITMAVAIGLLIFGYQIGVAEGDKEVFEIFKGIAAIPGLVGVALFLAGLFQAMTRKKSD